MISVKNFEVTFLDTHCYLIIDINTGKKAVVDPGDKSQSLIDELKESDSKLEYVLLTHGHYDHIGFAKELAEMFGAKIVIGEEGKEFLNKGTLNLSDFHRDICILNPFEGDIFLKDNDTLKLGDSTIKYITTPGHTKGCGCYIIDDNLFCGDTLFCESHGRTDLPTGNENQMYKSLKKLKDLEGDFKVYPGHGPFSTLDHERKYNPVMRML
ncbi:MAG: MBL fold metallo-hydrolase [Ruminococcus sp.]|nr:MBL fold metallo-hydrolase [Ruminococcus sp.]